MKKRYRLKKWVKVTLVILEVIFIDLLLGFILVKGANDFDELARECDQDRGYTCTYYDIRQYSLGK